MQLVRREVGVRRIVAVKAADRCIAKEDGTASIWLQPMLVRIDNDAVALRDRSICRGSSGRKRTHSVSGQEDEEAPVRAIDMNSEFELFLELQDFVDWV